MQRWKYYHTYQVEHYDSQVVVRWECPKCGIVNILSINPIEDNTYNPENCFHCACCPDMLGEALRVGWRQVS